MGLHIRPSCCSSCHQHEESSVVGDPTDAVQSPPPHLTSTPAGHGSSNSDEQSSKTPEGGEGNEGRTGEGIPPTMDLHSTPDVPSEENRIDETVRFVSSAREIRGFPVAGHNLFNVRTKASYVNVRVCAVLSVSAVVCLFA